MPTLGPPFCSEECAYSAEKIIHPNGALELKPWGVKEFSVLDFDGNLVTFQQDPS